MAGIQVGSSYARPKAVDPRLPVSQPNYYLQGGNGTVPDPKYGQNKADYEGQRAYNQALDYDRNAIFSNAVAGTANVSMAMTDPRTGLQLRYDPKSGGGAGGPESGIEMEDFDFDAAYNQAASKIPSGAHPVKEFARVTGPSPADSAAAQAAEFGRAKDRIGKIGRGSMTALQESYSSRGFGGSRLEGADTASLLSDLQGQTGEVIRDQAIQNLVRQRQVEDRNYAGDINQRSQDIGYATSTRGQDINLEGQRTSAVVPLLQLIAANRKKRRVVY
jgi:hypothetical protein